MSATSLPIELIEKIIDDLACDGIAHLKNCVLTCRTLVPVCRKYLFASMSVTLRPPLPVGSSEQAISLLKKSPEIANYTRHLRANLESALDSLENLAFPPEMKLFSRLESYFLSTSAIFGVNINRMTLEAKRFLLLPLTPTLTTLRLYQIRNFPFHELPICCPNLRDLDVDSIRIDDPDGLPTSVNLSPSIPIKLERLCTNGGLGISTNYWHMIALEKLTTMLQSNGQPVVDLSGLKDLHFVCNHEEYDLKTFIAMRSILSRTNHLATFTLEHHNFNLTGLGKLLRPYSIALKKIIIIVINHRFENSVHLLCDELAVLGQHPNILQSFCYRLFAKVPNSDYASINDDVQAFDAVFNTYAWPKLETFQVNMTISVLDSGEIGEIRSHADALEMKLNTTLEKRFPLLRRKSKENADFKLTTKVDVELM